MPKVGINVGEDFPAEDVAPPEREPDDDFCREHEKWRAKARALKDDVHRAARKHFGTHTFTIYNTFVLRALLAVALVALVLAILPHVFLLAMLVLGIVFFVAHHGRFHHNDYYDAPHGDA